MEAFKIEDRHGIILYDSTLAGAGLDGQDEEEDPPEEEVQENEEFEAEFEAEDATAEEEEATQAPEDQEEESGEELLQGDEQPKVRRSTRTVARRKVMNITKNSAKTYDAQLSQAVEGEIEYDLQE
jgi:hypothetical protein